MSLSLTDQPKNVFKFFDFRQLVDQFELQCSFKRHRRSPDDVTTVVEDWMHPAEPDGLKKVLVSETQKDPADEEKAIERSSSQQTVEEPVFIEEQTLLEHLELLSRELIPDIELSRLPVDAIKEVFPFFMRANFQMPDIDSTPLGSFLLKKKDEQIEDLTTYELEQTLSLTLKENKILDIQNDLFRRFLKKNDPRYNEEISGNSVQETLLAEDQNEETSLDISTAEMIGSKVIFPDAEDYDTEDIYRTVLGLYTRVAEHEIKSVHKEYEVELNTFNAKIKDLSSIKNSYNIHRDKIRETASLLKGVILKKRKKKRNKFIFDPLQFAEFLKATIRQDQQDLRRFNVMIYEHKKKISTLQKNMKSSNTVRRVDLELYEIKAKQLSAKLNESNEEFLQLKKIFDSYQIRVDKLQKRVEINRKMLHQNHKTYSKKLRDLQVQYTCYKMAFESIMGVINFIERIHSAVLLNK